MGDDLSESSEGLLQRGKGEARIYRSSLLENNNNKKPNVVEHQMMTASHREQTSQVNGFSAFLRMGRFKDLGSLKLFLKYAS